MSDLGKVLMFLGGILLVFGFLLMIGGRVHLPAGKMPGDIVYRGKHTVVYFPIVTSLVISVLLTAILYVIGRFEK